MEDLFSLARGLTQYVMSFSGYIINGYRFHIEEQEKSFITQNSGVVVIGNTGQGDENIDYYGVLTDVLKLQYLVGKRVVSGSMYMTKLEGLKWVSMGLLALIANSN